MHNVVPRVPVISGPQAIVSTTPGARADPVGLEWPHWCSCSTRFACRVAHLTAIPTNIRPRGDPGRARSDRGPHSGPLPKGAPHQRCRADSGMGQCRRRASRAGAGGARRRLPRHSEHETGTLGNDRPKTEPPCPTPNGPGGVPTRSLVGSCAASSETSSRMNCRLARRCPRSWSDTAVRPHRQPNLLITAVRRQGCPRICWCVPRSRRFWPRLGGRTWSAPRIEEAVAMRAAADADLDAAVVAARTSGWSWAEIGRVVGITRQSARERWMDQRGGGGVPVGRPDLTSCRQGLSRRLGRLCVTEVVRCIGRPAWRPWRKP